jgi:hypothetical protein
MKRFVVGRVFKLSDSSPCYVAGPPLIRSDRKVGKGRCAWAWADSSSVALRSDTFLSRHETHSYEFCKFAEKILWISRSRVALDSAYDIRCTLRNSLRFTKYRTRGIRYCMTVTAVTEIQAMHE